MVQCLGVRVIQLKHAEHMVISHTNSIYKHLCPQMFTMGLSGSVMGC